MDPYELWNVGVKQLPRPGRPDLYRALVFAMAHWVQEHDRMQNRIAINDLMIAAFGTDDDEAR
jgi:hypothetical protein